MKTILSKLALFLGAWMMTGAAMALEGSQTFDVTANVLPGCLIAVKTHMAFGTLDVRSNTAVESPATFEVTCTKGSGDVSLTFASVTGNSLGQTSTFKMIHATDAAAAITYEFYKADKMTVITPNAVTPFAELKGDGTAKILTITGRIAGAAKKDAIVGTYKDTVTMTATYPAI